MRGKLSTQMVKDNAAIFVGDVASAKLVKTRMAKSTLDAGMGHAQDDVGIQEPSGRCRLRGRQRELHNPDVFVLRGYSRQQSER